MNGTAVIPAKAGIHVSTTTTTLSIFFVFLILAIFFFPRLAYAQRGNVYGICICDNAPLLQNKTCSQFTVAKPESELSAACDAKCSPSGVDLFTTTLKPLTCAEYVRCTLDPSKCDVEAAAGSADLVGELQPQIEQLNRLGKGITVQKLIGRIIKVVLQVVGSLALLIFVYGGITWMTARGNSEKTQRAAKIIVWGALGVAVILASYTLTDFIFQTVR